MAVPVPANQVGDEPGWLYDHADEWRKGGHPRKCHLESINGPSHKQRLGRARKDGQVWFLCETCDGSVEWRND